MNLFDYEDELNRTIPMPNGLFREIKEWTVSGAVKSNQHQEFIYSYYWLLVYLWRYAKYHQHSITQKTIKQLLQYNPYEKRLDYLIKKNGILDMVGLTEVETDYPVSWNQKGDGELSFTMLSEFNSDVQRMIKADKPLKYAVKSPVRHIGNGIDDGLFWSIENTHEIPAYVFKICMENEQLGCAGFYLYSILKYIEDKSSHFNKNSTFELGNETLENITLWKLRKIIKVTDELVRVGLIHKDREKKMIGKRNRYKIIRQNYVRNESQTVGV